ncbi:hypothetical protein HAX54_045741, partial [Datura stramonium]|nr:hypothetical protein [Datura stramonium]
HVLLSRRLSVVPSHFPFPQLPIDRPSSLASKQRVTSVSFLPHLRETGRLLRRLPSSQGLPPLRAPPPAPGER